MARKPGKAIRAAHNGASAAGGPKQARHGRAPGARPSTPPADDLPRPSNALTAVLCLILALTVFPIYAQTHHHDFVAYDDDVYVYRNTPVKEGLTASGAAWAFTTFHCSNWHPVTWLSHMLDCQLFGLDTGAHHLVNVGFHAVNTLLLFVAFASMTRRPWRSAVVAAIFAVHPLHVESVAWIAERKDVLSTSFALVTMLFYIRYARRPKVLTYIFMAFFFALALMAKPMVVTLPFVLLLLDIWPLGRLQWPPSWRTLGNLTREKAPLFVLAAAGSVTTFIAQQTTGAVLPLAGMSLSGRFVNAFVACATYLLKAFFPAKMGVFYPPHVPSAGIAALAFVTVMVVTLAAIAFGKKHRACLVGWFWFLGMLVPVSGIVKAGAQAMAERYMYLPLAGLSVAVVWLAADLVERRPLLMRVCAAAACAAVVCFGLSAYRQAGYWKSSRALFEHTLAVTTGNYIMHNNLGVILAQEGKYGEASAHYREAVAINPRYEEAHGNLGHELLRSGDLEGARTHLARSVEIWPYNARYQALLAEALVKQGKLADARKPLEQAIRLAPGKSEYHSNLGYVLHKLGRLDGAIAAYAEAVRLKPDSAEAHYNMGLALSDAGKRAEADAEFARANALDPNYSPFNLLLQQLRGVK